MVAKVFESQYQTAEKGVGAAKEAVKDSQSGGWRIATQQPRLDVIYIFTNDEHSCDQKYRQQILSCVVKKPKWPATVPSCNDISLYLET